MSNIKREKKKMNQNKKNHKINNKIKQVDLSKIYIIL
jgi:hypothetical protein